MPSFSLLSLLFLSLIACAASQADDLTITTAYGPVTGYLSASGNVRVWKGVPFAAPPVGNLRWTSPQAPNSWSTPIIANVSGSPCVQSTTSSSSEDCLYLNIFVPANHTTSATALPVMVWVYGGAFVSGSNANIDGEYLAGNEMIFVALNYRVGMMGFFAHNALANDADHASGVGFYGIQDVRFALQWVQNNIAAFGGDPKLVTIAGESAGAFAICSLMATAKAQGLFSRIIMSSTHCTVDTQEQGLTRGNTLATALGCNGMSDADALACLLAKNQSEIYTAQSQYSYGTLPYQRLPGRFWPSIWADELSDQPSVIVSKGGGVRVPLLLGNNLNESALYNCPTMIGINASTAESYIEDEINSQTTDSTGVQNVLKAYNVDSYSTPVSAFNDFQTDFVYRCHSVSTGLAFANSNQNVYMYALYHAPAFGLNKYTSDQANCLGVPHGIDLNYYGMTDGTLTQLTAPEANLSSIMRNAWVSFARDGKPTLPGGMQWPTYEAKNQNYLIYDTPLSTGTQLRKGQCDVLIDAIGGDPMNQPGFYDSDEKTDLTTSGISRVAAQLATVFALAMLILF